MCSKFLSMYLLLANQYEDRRLNFWHAADLIYRGIDCGLRQAAADPPQHRTATRNAFLKYEVIEPLSRT